MTPAEEALVAACLKTNLEEDAQELSLFIHSVREERCPSALYDRALAIETKYRHAMEEYRFEGNELRLNYPEETVDAAFSKARRELRGNR